MEFFKICLLILILSSCDLNNNTEESNHGKIGTYNELKRELKGDVQEYSTPMANISELEATVNNGGFNQYFFNSSGQNCFETLKSLERNNKPVTAGLLKEAIRLINPDNLSAENLINKIRKRKIELLDDPIVIEKLDSLDNIFFKYLDGDL